MKPKFLYHGSIRKILGYLTPHKPEDLENRKENIKKGVYASNIKNDSIAMAIISSKGVIYASLSFKKRKKALIYEGWPKQRYIYLYTLPSITFNKSSNKSSQWVSRIKVKPTKIERLKIKDYIHLIRKATEKEIKSFKTKYKLK